MDIYVIKHVFYFFIKSVYFKSTQKRISMAIEKQELLILLFNYKLTICPLHYCNNLVVVCLDCRSIL